MMCPHSFKIIFLSIFISLPLVSCHNTNNLTHNNATIIKPNILVQAPKGSYVKPYINHKSIEQPTAKSQNYKVFLQANTGNKRIATEYATLTFPINFKQLSFTLIGDQNLISLKTPITLIDIIDQNNKTILSLKLHNNIYWIETHIKENNKSHRIPMFLDHAKEDFVITHNKHTMNFKIGDYTKNIAHHTQDYKIKIGITRHDLLRYSGIYLLEQTLYINNMVVQ